MKKQKNLLRKLKNKKKCWQKGFSKYFNHEPSALVIELLGQNTEDLKKSLDEIKQQNIELNKDEINSTKCK